MQQPPQASGLFVRRSAPPPMAAFGPPRLQPGYKCNRRIYYGLGYSRCEAKNLDYLSAEEVRSFLVAAEEAGTRNELVCRLLVNTGMRREELVALTVGDVDVNRGSITLNKVVFSATMLGILSTHGSRKRP